MTFAGRFFDHCFTAPERITAAEWSEQHRRLSPEASAKGGLFSFETNPWQREVLELVSDPTCGRIVLQWASQVTGKTETLINAIGYHVDVDPCPMLIIQPTLEMAEAFSKDRIATLARDTPRLRNKIIDPRSRNSGNTHHHHGIITLVAFPRRWLQRPRRSSSGSGPRTAASAHSAS